MHIHTWLLQFIFFYVLDSLYVWYIPSRYFIYLSHVSYTLSCVFRQSYSWFFCWFIIIIQFVIFNIYVVNCVLIFLLCMKVFFWNTQNRKHFIQTKIYLLTFGNNRWNNSYKYNTRTKKMTDWALKIFVSSKKINILKVPYHTNKYVWPNTQCVYDCVCAHPYSKMSVTWNLDSLYIYC